jgi:uncharacterized protein
MITIFMASVSPFSGKNVVCLGLAQRLRAEGKRVGYFKPLGLLSERREGSAGDDDALLFKEALQLSEPVGVLCPLALTHENFMAALRGELGDVRKLTMAAFNKAAENKDVMIVKGMGRLSAGTFLGYAEHQFIKETAAVTVVVDKYAYPIDALDGLLHVKSIIGDRMIGAVFNRIAAGKVEEINNSVRSFLKSREIDVLGAVPADPVLAAIPLAELTEILRAKVLCASRTQDVLIENFLIGAMNSDAALSYFQRTPNLAVITGGDRADIEMAALAANAKCLILTGGLLPNERVLMEAERQGIAVLLVQTHTSATLEACERSGGRLSLRSPRKLQRVNEVVGANLDFGALYRKAGIK